MHFETAVFTQGKSDDPKLNEDRVVTTRSTVVVADGATAKNAELNARLLRRTGQSGGALIAELVASTAAGSNNNGRALIIELTRAIQALYRELVPEALNDPLMRIASTLVVLRLGQDGQMDLTWLGDTSCRFRGRIYHEERTQDVLDAGVRARRIRELIDGGMTPAEAAPLGREAIAASLADQPRLWNNAGHPLGFGYLNGDDIPEKFVHHRTFTGKHRAKPGEVIELYTDGYFAPPTFPPGAQPAIAAWEAAYAAALAEDPYRIGRYPATKPVDDRSIAIVTIR